MGKRSKDAGAPAPGPDKQKGREKEAKKITLDEARGHLEKLEKSVVDLLPPRSNGLWQKVNELGDKIRGLPDQDAFEKERQVISDSLRELEDEISKLAEEYKRTKEEMENRTRSRHADILEIYKRIDEQAQFFVNPDPEVEKIRELIRNLDSAKVTWQEAKHKSDSSAGDKFNIYFGLLNEAEQKVQQKSVELEKESFAKETVEKFEELFETMDPAKDYGSELSAILDKMRELKNKIMAASPDDVLNFGEEFNESHEKAFKIIKEINELPAPTASAPEAAPGTTPAEPPAAPAAAPAPAREGWLKRVWSKTKKVAAGAAGVVSHPLDSAEKGFFWGLDKSKKFVFNKDVRNLAVKTALETGASVFGAKTFYDVAGYAVGRLRGRDEGGGWGDIEKYAYAKQDAKKGRTVIKNSFEDFLAVYGVAPENRAEEEKNRVTDKAKILYDKIAKAPGLSKEEKTKFKKHLGDILRSYAQNRGTAEAETKKQVGELTDLYIKNKVSGMGLIKDALNTALTATGFVALRGAVYAGTSVAERMLRANAEYNKANFGKTKDQKESRLGALAKDTLINSTVETLRGLVFMGEKKGAKGKQRIIDFIKSAGIVARGLGIYGVAIAGGEGAGATLGRFLKSIDSNNLAGSIWHNYDRNADRVFNLPHNLHEKFFGHAPAGGHHEAIAATSKIAEATPAAVTATAETHSDASLQPAAPAASHGGPKFTFEPASEPVTETAALPEASGHTVEATKGMGITQLEKKLLIETKLTNGFNEQGVNRSVLADAKKFGWITKEGEWHLRAGAKVDIAMDEKGSFVLPAPEKVEGAYFVPKGSIEMPAETASTVIPSASEESLSGSSKEAGLALDNSRKVAEMSSLVIDTMSLEQQEKVFDALEALVEKRDSVPPEQFAQMFNELYTATTGLPPETLEAARGAEYRDQLKDIFAAKGEYKKELVDNLDRLAKEKAALGGGLASHNIGEGGGLASPELHGSGGGLASPELQRGGGANIRENISPKAAKIIAEAKQELAAGQKVEAEKIIAQAQKELEGSASGEGPSAGEQVDAHYYTLDNTESRTWELRALARDKDGTSYEVRVFEDKKVAVYVRESDGLIYNRKGNLIGFTGSDHKLHMHPPKSGWGEISAKGVGEIKNKFEGTGKLPDFSKYKSPKI